VAIEGFSIAFSDPMLEPDPEWTRIDDWSGLVASYSIRRGRVDEMQKTGTGTAVVELNDREGFFDASNSFSPFFEAGIDGKQAGLALWNPVDEEWVTIFRGFIEGYQYEIEPSGVVTRIQVELVDALDYLAGVELSPETAGHPGDAPEESLGDVFYGSQQVDDRIDLVLTNAGWPGALSTVFSGNVQLKSTVYPPGTTALAALEDAADGEFPGVANLYVDKKGRVTFHGRHARFDPAGVIAGPPPIPDDVWDFHEWNAGDGSITGTDSSYAQIRRLAYSRPRANVINAAMALPDRNGEADLTPAQIFAQVVVDTTPGADNSITKYGVHSWSAENLLTWYKLGEAGESPTNNDLTETKKFASYYVENYRLPQSRVTQLGFRSIRPDDPRGPATWRLLTGVEVSDVLHLKTAHPGGGGFDQDFFVEGVTYEVRPLTPDYADVTLSLDISARAHYDHDPFGD
jgi:hypothetical protein